MNIVETTKKKRIVEFKYWNLGKKKTREKWTERCKEESLRFTTRELSHGWGTYSTVKSSCTCLQVHKAFFNHAQKWDINGSSRSSV
jgi:hypothetical protein